jgi:polar amino acid transport system substrate-binding protein
MKHLRPRLTLAAAATATLALVACGPAPRDTPPAPVAGAAAAAPAALPAAAAPPKVPTCSTADGGDGKSAIASVAPGGTVAELRAAAVEQLENPGRLIVGTSADVLLWGARDPESGQLAGFDIELAKRISTALFGREVPIEFRVVNYNQRLPSLGATPADGEKPAPKVDLVLHTMTINCARWKRISFSTEYYRAGQRVVVRADNPVYLKKGEAMQITELPEGAQICVPDGSTNQEKLAADFKQFKAVPVPEIGECLVKFQKGQVDAVTGDDTVLAGFAAQDPYAKIIGDQLTLEPYGVGVAREDAALLRFVNAVLEELRPAGLQKIYDDTMGQALPGTMPRTTVAYERVVRPTP